MEVIQVKVINENIEAEASGIIGASSNDAGGGGALVLAKGTR